MLLTSLKKVFAVGVAGVILATQVVWAHKPDVSLWEQRRQALKTPTPPVLLAQAPFPLPPAESARFFKSISSLKPANQNRFLPTDNRLTGLFKNFPSAAGSIRKVALPAGSGFKRVVVHVQDIHMNPEAQRNIGRILESLLSNQPVEMIGLEGAFGPIDLGYFHDYSRRKTIEKVAGFLLDENKLSGALYGAMLHDKKRPLIAGVDDVYHYRANVGAYRRSSSRKKEVLLKLDAAARAITEEKRRLFNPALLEFEEKATAYRSGALSLGAYAENFAGSLNAAFVALPLFLKAYRLETALNFQEVEAERLRLLSSLMAALSKSRADELVEAAVAFRASRLKASEFYSYLKNLCLRHGVPLSRYPAMRDYLDYVLAADQIDAEALFEEIQRAEDECYGRLIRSPEEAGMVQASKRLQLTEKLVDFSLTKPEWELYKDLKIQAPTSKFQTNVKLQKEKHSEFGKLKFAWNLDVGIWDLSSFEDFYKEAEARDASMAANFLQRLAASESKVSVLVTGGFHSAGIDRALTQAGVAVVSVAPKITKADLGSGSAYLNVFTQEKTPLEKLVQGQKLFLSPLQEDSFPLFRLLMRAWEAREPGQSRVNLPYGDSTVPVVFGPDGNFLPLAQQPSTLMSAGLFFKGMKLVKKGLIAAAGASLAAALLFGLVYFASSLPSTKISRGFYFALLGPLVGALLVLWANRPGGRRGNSQRSFLTEKGPVLEAFFRQHGMNRTRARAEVRKIAQWADRFEVKESGLYLAEKDGVVYSAYLVMSDPVHKQCAVAVIRPRFNWEDVSYDDLYQEALIRTIGGSNLSDRKEYLQGELANMGKALQQEGLPVKRYQELQSRSREYADELKLLLHPAATYPPIGLENDFYESVKRIPLNGETFADLMARNFMGTDVRPINGIFRTADVRWAAPPSFSRGMLGFVENNKKDVQKKSLNDEAEIKADDPPAIVRLLKNAGLFDPRLSGAAIDPQHEMEIWSELGRTTPLPDGPRTYIQALSDVRDYFHDNPPVRDLIVAEIRTAMPPQELVENIKKLISSEQDASLKALSLILLFALAKEVGLKATFTSEDAIGLEALVNEKLPEGIKRELENIISELFPIGPLLRPSRMEILFSRDINPAGDTRAVSSGQNVFLINLQNGRARRKIEAMGTVQRVEFSPSGKKIIIASEQGLEMWNLEGNFRETSVRMPSYDLREWALNKQETRLAVSSRGPGWIGFWNIGGGGPHFINGNQDAAHLLFSPDGGKIIWSTTWGAIYVSDIPTGDDQPKPQVFKPNLSPVDLMVFHPNEKALTFYARDRGIFNLDLTTEKITRVSSLWPAAMVYLDETSLAFKELDNPVITILDAADTGKPYSPKGYRYDQPFDRGVFLNDSWIVPSIDKGLSRLNTRGEMAPAYESGEKISDVEASPDGAWLAAWSATKKLFFWKTAKPSFYQEFDLPAAPIGLGFDRTSRVLFVISGAGHVYRFELSDSLWGADGTVEGLARTASNTLSQVPADIHPEGHLVLRRFLHRMALVEVGDQLNERALDHDLPPPPHSLTGAFGQKGRIVIASNGTNTTIYDTESGRRVADVPYPVNPYRLQHEPLDGWLLSVGVNPLTLQKIPGFEFGSDAPTGAAGLSRWLFRTEDLFKIGLGETVAGVTVSLVAIILGLLTGLIHAPPAFQSVASVFSYLNAHLSFFLPALIVFSLAVLLIHRISGVLPRSGDGRTAAAPVYSWTRSATATAIVLGSVAGAIATAVLAQFLIGGWISGFIGLILGALLFGYFHGLINAPGAGSLRERFPKIKQTLVIVGWIALAVFILVALFYFAPGISSKKPLLVLYFAVPMVFYFVFSGLGVQQPVQNSFGFLAEAPQVFRVDSASNLHKLAGGAISATILNGLESAVREISLIYSGVRINQVILMPEAGEFLRVDPVQGALRLGRDAFKSAPILRFSLMRGFIDLQIGGTLEAIKFDDSSRRAFNMYARLQRQSVEDDVPTIIRFNSYSRMRAASPDIDPAFRHAVVYSRLLNLFNTVFTPEERMHLINDIGDRTLAAFLAGGPPEANKGDRFLYSISFLANHGTSFPVFNDEPSVSAASPLSLSEFHDVLRRVVQSAGPHLKFGGAEGPIDVSAVLEAIPNISWRVDGIKGPNFLRTAEILRLLSIEDKKFPETDPRLLRALESFLGPSIVAKLYHWHGPRFSRFISMLNPSHLSLFQELGPERSVRLLTQYLPHFTGEQGSSSQRGRVDDLIPLFDQISPGAVLWLADNEPAWFMGLIGGKVNFIDVVRESISFFSGLGRWLNEIQVGLRVIRDLPANLFYLPLNESFQSFFALDTLTADLSERFGNSFVEERRKKDPIAFLILASLFKNTKFSSEDLDFVISKQPQPGALADLWVKDPPNFARTLLFFRYVDPEWAEMIGWKALYEGMGLSFYSDWNFWWTKDAEWGEVFSYLPGFFTESPWSAEATPVLLFKVRSLLVSRSPWISKEALQKIYRQHPSLLNRFVRSILTFSDQEEGRMEHFLQRVESGEEEYTPEEMNLWLTNAPWPEWDSLVEILSPERMARLLEEDPMPFITFLETFGTDAAAIHRKIELTRSVRDRLGPDPLIELIRRQPHWVLQAMRKGSPRHTVESWMESFLDLAARSVGRGRRNELGQWTSHLWQGIHSLMSSSSSSVGFRRPVAVYRKIWAHSSKSEIIKSVKRLFRNNAPGGMFVTQEYQWYAWMRKLTGRRGAPIISENALAQLIEEKPIQIVLTQRILSSAGNSKEKYYRGLERLKEIFHWDNATVERLFMSDPREVAMMAVRIGDQRGRDFNRINIQLGNFRENHSDFINENLHRPPILFEIIIASIENRDFTLFLQKIDRLKALAPALLSECERSPRVLLWLVTALNQTDLDDRFINRIVDFMVRRLKEEASFASREGWRANDRLEEAQIALALFESGLPIDEADVLDFWLWLFDRSWLPIDRLKNQLDVAGAIRSNIGFAGRLQSLLLEQDPLNPLFQKAVGLAVQMPEFFRAIANRAAPNQKAKLHQAAATAVVDRLFSSFKYSPSQKAHLNQAVAFMVEDLLDPMRSIRRIRELTVAGLGLGMLPSGEAAAWIDTYRQGEHSRIVEWMRNLDLSLSEAEGLYAPIHPSLLARLMVYSLDNLNSSKTTIEIIDGFLSQNKAFQEFLRETILAAVRDGDRSALVYHDALRLVVRMPVRRDGFVYQLDTQDLNEIQRRNLRGDLLNASLEERLNGMISSHADTVLNTDNGLGLVSLQSKLQETPLPVTVQSVQSFFVDLGIDMSQAFLENHLNRYLYAVWHGMVVPRLQILYDAYRGSRTFDDPRAVFITQAITVALKYASRGGEAAEGDGERVIHQWSLPVVSEEAPGINLNSSNLQADLVFPRVGLIHFQIEGRTSTEEGLLHVGFGGHEVAVIPVPLHGQVRTILIQDQVEEQLPRVVQIGRRGDKLYFFAVDKFVALATFPAKTPGTRAYVRQVTTEGRADLETARHMIRLQTLERMITKEILAAIELLRNTERLEEAAWAFHRIRDAVRDLDPGFVEVSSRGMKPGLQQDYFDFIFGSLKALIDEFETNPAFYLDGRIQPAGINELKTRVASNATYARLREARDIREGTFETFDDPRLPIDRYHGRALNRRVLGNQFIDLLRLDPQPSRRVRELFEQGDLEHFLHEVTDLRGIRQTQRIHGDRTAEEHTLRVVEMMDRLYDALVQAQAGRQAGTPLEITPDRDSLDGQLRRTANLLLDIPGFQLQPRYLYLLAALFHDAGKSVQQGGHSERSAQMLGNFLTSSGISQEIIDRWQRVVRHHQYIGVNIAASRVRRVVNPSAETQEHYNQRLDERVRVYAEDLGHGITPEESIEILNSLMVVTIADSLAIPFTGVPTADTGNRFTTLFSQELFQARNEVAAILNAGESSAGADIDAGPTGAASLSGWLLRTNDLFKIGLGETVAGVTVSLVALILGLLTGLIHAPPAFQSVASVFSYLNAHLSFFLPALIVFSLAVLLIHRISGVLPRSGDGRTAAAPVYSWTRSATATAIVLGSVAGALIFGLAALWLVPAGGWVSGFVGVALGAILFGFMHGAINAPKKAQMLGRIFLGLRRFADEISYALASAGPNRRQFLMSGLIAAGLVLAGKAAADAPFDTARNERMLVVPNDVFAVIRELQKPNYPDAHRAALFQKLLKLVSKLQSQYFTRAELRFIYGIIGSELSARIRLMSPDTIREAQRFLWEAQGREWRAARDAFFAAQPDVTRFLIQASARGSLSNRLQALAMAADFRGLKGALRKEFDTSFRDIVAAIEVESRKPLRAADMPARISLLKNLGLESALGLSKGSVDRIVRLLMGVMADNRQPIEVRIAAYEALGTTLDLNLRSNVVRLTQKTASEGFSAMITFILNPTVRAAFARLKKEILDINVIDLDILMSNRAIQHAIMDKAPAIRDALIAALKAKEDPALMRDIYVLLLRVNSTKTISALLDWVEARASAKPANFYDTVDDLLSMLEGSGFFDATVEPRVLKLIAHLPKADQESRLTRLKDVKEKSSKGELKPSKVAALPKETDQDILIKGADIDPWKSLEVRQSPADKAYVRAFSGEVDQDKTRVQQLTKFVQFAEKQAKGLLGLGEHGPAAVEVFLEILRHPRLPLALRLRAHALITKAQISGRESQPGDSAAVLEVVRGAGRLTSVPYLNGDEYAKAHFPQIRLHILRHSLTRPGVKNAQGLDYNEFLNGMMFIQGRKKILNTFDLATSLLRQKNTSEEAVLEATSLLWPASVASVRGAVHPWEAGPMAFTWLPANANKEQIKQLSAYLTASSFEILDRARDQNLSVPARLKMMHTVAYAMSKLNRPPVGPPAPPIQLIEARRELARDVDFLVSVVAHWPAIQEARVAHRLIMDLPRLNFRAKEREWLRRSFEAAIKRELDAGMDDRISLLFEAFGVLRVAHKEDVDSFNKHKNWPKKLKTDEIKKGLINKPAKPAADKQEDATFPNRVPPANPPPAPAPPKIISKAEQEQALGKVLAELGTPATALLLGVAHMNRPTGLSPEQEKRFDGGFVLMWRAALARLFTSLRVALVTVFMKNPGAPTLVFVNERKDLQSLKEAFEEAKRQTIRGKKSYVWIALPTQSLGSSLERDVRRLETDYRSFVVSAHVAIGQGGYRAAADPHGKAFVDASELFRALAGMESMRSDPGARDMLLKLSDGDPAIGVRIIQINQPALKHVWSKSILDLVILLLPEAGKAGVIDFRALLQIATNA